LAPAKSAVDKVMMEQVCRMCSGIWLLSPHSHTAVGWSPKFPQVLMESAV
jgi:hypothetical protein